MRALLPDLMSIAGPLIVAALTYYTSDWILAYRNWLTAQPPAIKRGVVLAVASAITLGAKVLSVELPTDLALWDPNTIDVLVSAGIALATKAGNTAKAAKADAQDARQAIG